MLNLTINNFNIARQTVSAFSFAASFDVAGRYWSFVVLKIVRPN